MTFQLMMLYVLLIQFFLCTRLFDFFVNLAGKLQDLARFLIGEEPSHVYAAASTFLPGAQPLVAAGKKAPDDTAVIVLQFPR